MSDNGHKPTRGMIEEAKRGLEWRREFNRGGTAVGVARARDIANGRNLSDDTVRRMNSYFARHEVDKQGQGWSPGQPGFPSAGRIAWALWGGDPGKSFAETITTRLKKEQERNMASIEVRTTTNALERNGGVLRGYASTFNEPYDMGRFDEVVSASAFQRTLREQPDVIALVNHDSAKPLARTTNGSLRLNSDERGLQVEIEPIATTYAADLMEAVRAGVVTAMSFGFNVKQDRFEQRGSRITRVIEDVDLHEVSVVSFPANPGTSVTLDARSFERFIARRWFLIPQA